jgi:hypothetical protein
VKLLGRNITQDGSLVVWRESAEALREAADGGEAEAMGWSGVCLLEGKGVGKDVDRACIMLRRAARKGGAEPWRASVLEMSGANRDWRAPGGFVTVAMELGLPEAFPWAFQQLGLSGGGDAWWAMGRLTGGGMALVCPRAAVGGAGRRLSGRSGQLLVTPLGSGNGCLPCAIESFGDFSRLGALCCAYAPGGVKSVAKGQFDGCDQLRHTSTKGSSLMAIPPMAFAGCPLLERIDVPSSVTQIGECAFLHCKELRAAAFGDDSALEVIGERGFAGCLSMQRVDIPSAVTLIGEGAFSECRGLRAVAFGGRSSLGQIADHSFGGCWSLERAVIPSSVTRIGKGAFRSCRGLKDVSFEGGSSLEVIGEETFEDCLSLKRIVIPKSVTLTGKCAFIFLRGAAGCGL